MPPFEGYGATTPGGAGGATIHVTSLADSGAGSLRAALATAGPRTVVFDLAGTITVATPLLVTQPFCTIQGQSAPAPGITLVTAQQDVPNTLWIQTHDVIVEHIAIRPLLGGYDPQQPAWGVGVFLDPGSYNVVIDHCSISHVTERCISANNASDVTLSWCVFARGLGIGKGLSAHGTSTRYSVHHCVFGDLYQRSPQVSRMADVRHNVVYDWDDFGAYAHNIEGDTTVNIVGNTILAGPHTAGISEGIGISDWRLNTVSAPNAGTIGVYLASNTPTEITIGRWLDSSTIDALTVQEATDLGILVGTPFSAPAITAGGSIYPSVGRSPRDTTDAALMRELGWPPQGSPYIQSSAVTNGTTATGFPSVGLPSGIVAGDLIVVLFRTANGIAGINWPAGWTELVESTTDASNDATAIGYRRATGPEVGPITLTTASARYAAIALRISGAENPAIQPPEVSATAIGLGDQPNPNACTPTGGAKDYLWIWAGGWEGWQTSPPAGTPAGYSDPLGAHSGIAGFAGGNVRVALASRTLAAVSENPGPWQTSWSDDWTAWTLAVHPATLFGPNDVDGETLKASPRGLAAARKRQRLASGPNQMINASATDAISDTEKATVTGSLSQHVASGARETIRATTRERLAAKP